MIIEINNAWFYRKEYLPQIVTSTHTHMQTAEQYRNCLKTIATLHKPYIQSIPKETHI